MSAGCPPAGLYILGFGGHARSVGDIAASAGIGDLVFIDEAARPDESFAGFNVVERLPAELLPGWLAFPAAGDNGRRRLQVEQSVLDLALLVAPSAHIGLRAEVGRGTLVGQHAHVGPLARIGRGVIINTGAIVDHESVVGDFTHVSINAAIAGRCAIGCGVMIGAGATVIDGVRVCDDVVIGAGATVVRHIDLPGTYVGTPARRIA